jgi:hypothetical protein
VRTIKVRVGPDGQVETAFSGFLDDACIDEREKLRQVLAGFGVSLDMLSRREVRDEPQSVTQRGKIGNETA